MLGQDLRAYGFLLSGMAGNVTAFNTVWTYDIYQSYIRKNASDAHYLWMGRMATIFGILLSIAAAYVATRFNNIMDSCSSSAFVNAPLLRHSCSECSGSEPRVTEPSSGFCRNARRGPASRIDAACPR